MAGRFPRRTIKRSSYLQGGDAVHRDEQFSERFMKRSNFPSDFQSSVSADWTLSPVREWGLASQSFTNSRVNLYTGWRTVG
jgi:hypothetical protein